MLILTQTLTRWAIIFCARGARAFVLHAPIRIEGLNRRSPSAGSGRAFDSALKLFRRDTPHSPRSRKARDLGQPLGMTDQVERIPVSSYVSHADTCK